MAVSSQDVLLCKSCNIVNARKNGRTCSACDNYHHLACVKLTKNLSAGLNTWHCRSCLPLRTPPTNRNSRPVPFPTDPRDILCRLHELRSVACIPKCIPKAARIQAADALSSTINEALVSNGADDWNRLVFFAPLALGLYRSKEVKCSLASRLKKRISAFRDNPDLHKTTFPDDIASSPVTSPSTATDRDASSQLRARVNSKLMEGDVSAAIRVLASDDTVVHPTPEVLTALRLKHPDAPADIRPITPPDGPPNLTVSEDCVLAALDSFPRSSSGGVDGIRPGHLRVLTSSHAGEAGERLKRRSLNWSTKLYAVIFLITPANCFFQLTFRRSGRKMEAFAQLLSAMFFAA